MSEQNKKYRRTLTGWAPGTDQPAQVEVDVYRVLDGFDVRDPALQHLIKKALAAGNRGHKDLIQDYQDIVHSANSALELARAKRQNEPVGDSRGVFSIRMSVRKDQVLDLSKMEDRAKVAATCLGNISKTLSDMAIAQDTPRFIPVRVHPIAESVIIMNHPYGRPAANQLHVMEFKCNTCSRDVITTVLETARTRPADGVCCPHCLQALDRPEFIAWRSVEAIMDNLARVPTAHLAQFFRAARVNRAGYGTDTSVRAALEQIIKDRFTHQPTAAEREAFIRTIWPNAAKWCSDVDAIAEILVSCGVGEGDEIVLSGRRTLKRKIASAARNIGATLRSSVGPKTKLLIVGQDPGAKLAKAQALGINIISTDDLIRACHNQKKETK